LGPNPRSAAEINNTTGKTLDGGADYCLRRRRLRGRGFGRDDEVGDKRLVGYAVDLGTKVATKLESGEQRVRLVTAKRGDLYVRTSIEASRPTRSATWTQKVKTLIIEHPIRQGFRLLGLTPAETTAKRVPLEVRLDSKSSPTFVVKEESL